MIARLRGLCGWGGRKVLRHKSGTFGPNQHWSFGVKFQPFSCACWFQAPTRAGLLTFAAGSGRCVCASGTAESRNFPRLWRSLPGGLALSLLQGRDGGSQLSKRWSCLELLRHWEVPGVKKRECHLEEINCHRKVERSAPYCWHTGPTVSYLMEKKNPLDLDNRHKENTFVWSNSTVKHRGLVPLCSCFPIVLEWGNSWSQLLASLPSLILPTWLVLRLCPGDRPWCHSSQRDTGYPFLPLYAFARPMGL